MIVTFVFLFGSPVNLLQIEETEYVIGLSTDK